MWSGPPIGCCRPPFSARDSIVLVKGARQMGKTSLLARGLQQAREAGARVVLTDFRSSTPPHLESAERALPHARRLARRPARPGRVAGPRLEGAPGPEQEFRAVSGAGRCWAGSQRRSCGGWTRWTASFRCAFASEVFGLFRSWHNERALDPGPLVPADAGDRLRHGGAPVHHRPEPVAVQRRHPLTLEDFTLEQVAELNQRYGSPLRDQASDRALLSPVGGHPYLVRRGLQEMATPGVGPRGA